jgi:death on curing protein
MAKLHLLDTAILIAIHDEQITLHGGASGLRDAGLLESALSRPLIKLQYGETNIAHLAAVLAFGIARNHPFIDGNKRTAYVAMESVLDMNGLRLTAPDADATIMFLRLASGEISEDDLTAWIAANVVPLIASKP